MAKYEDEKNRQKKVDENYLQLKCRQEAGRRTSLQWNKSGNWMGLFKIQLRRCAACNKRSKILRHINVCQCMYVSVCVYG